MTITKRMSWKDVRGLRRDGESTSAAMVRYGRETGWRVVTHTADAYFIFVRWWAWPVVHAWYRRPRVVFADHTVYLVWLPWGAQLWPPAIYRW